MNARGNLFQKGTSSNRRRSRSSTYDDLMAQLTAEEKDKIKELKKNIFNVIQPMA